MARGDETTSTALLRLARHVTARHDLDDVLTEVFRCLRPVVTFGGGSIQLLDDEGWIQMAACDPVAPEHVMAARIPLGTSVAGRVILTEQPVYLPDIEVRAPSDAGQQVSTGVRSYLGVPLVADGRAIGLLQVDSPDADAWSEEQRGLFHSVAPVVAAAIQNARAYARADVAKLRADGLRARLEQARHVVVAARAAGDAGDRLEADRQLARLEALLTDGADATAMQLPRQRIAARRLNHR